MSLLALLDADAGPVPAEGEQAGFVDDEIIVDWPDDRVWRGANRSAKFMAFLRAKKEAAQHARRAGASYKAVDTVAKSWNRMHALRFGDRIHDDEAQTNGSRITFPNLTPMSGASVG